MELRTSVATFHRGTGLSTGRKRIGSQREIPSASRASPSVCGLGCRSRPPCLLWWGWSTPPLWEHRSTSALFSKAKFDQLNAEFGCGLRWRTRSNARTSRYDSRPIKFIRKRVEDLLLPGRQLDDLAHRSDSWGGGDADRRLRGQSSHLVLSVP